MVPGSSTYNIGELLDWVFSLLLPNFTMSRGLQMLMLNENNEDSCQEFTTALCTSIEDAGRQNPCCPGSNIMILLHYYLAKYPSQLSILTYTYNCMISHLAVLSTEERVINHMHHNTPNHQIQPK